MRAISVVLAAGLMAGPALAGPALAQGARPAEQAENGRYSMTPVPEGFLRLDTRTGQTSLCRVEGSVARCQVAADERQAYENEIARLTKEAQALKDRSGKSGDDDGWGPYAQRNLDRALDFAEKFMRRMMQIMRDETSKS